MNVTIESGPESKPSIAEELLQRRLRRAMKRFRGRIRTLVLKLDSKTSKRRRRALVRLGLHDNGAPIVVSAEAETGSQAIAKAVGAAQRALQQRGASSRRRRPRRLQPKYRSTA